VREKLLIDIEIARPPEGTMAAFKFTKLQHVPLVVFT
jgi:hypothetical protein